MKAYQSQARKRKEAAQTARLQIMELMGWDQLTYGEFQYNTGVEYLQLIVKDAVVIQQMQESRIFWNWWKNHWVIRDENFIKANSLGDLCVSSSGNLIARFKAVPLDYKMTHNAYALASTIQPQGVVMHNAFAGMMGQIIDHL